jgi:hypothetical protein
MARSVAAVVAGFAGFDRAVRVVARAGAPIYAERGASCI